jgi:hypothetical protein
MKLHSNPWRFRALRGLLRRLLLILSRLPIQVIINCWWHLHHLIACLGQGVQDWSLVTLGCETVDRRDVIMSLFRLDVGSQLEYFVIRHADAHTCLDVEERYQLLDVPQIKV